MATGVTELGATIGNGGGGGGGTPGGISGDVQYNSAGNFAGSSNLTFDGTSLSVGGELISQNIITSKGDLIIDQHPTGTDRIITTTNPLHITSANILQLNGTVIDATTILDMGSNKIQNVANPTNPQDVVTLNYLDNNPVLNQQVLVSSFSNVPLTGSVGLVIDGVTITTGSTPSILLAGQTTASQNGVYNYSDNGSTYTLTLSPTFVPAVGKLVYTTSGTAFGATTQVVMSILPSIFVGQGFRIGHMPSTLSPYADNTLSIGVPGKAWFSEDSYNYNVDYAGAKVGNISSDGTNINFTTIGTQGIVLQTPNQTGSTNGAGTLIKAGDVDSGTAGDLDIYGGFSNSGAAGNINIAAGGTTGSATAGNITIFGQNTTTTQASGISINSGSATGLAGGVYPGQGYFNLMTDLNIGVVANNGSTTPNYMPSLLFFLPDYSNSVGFKGSSAITTSTTWTLPLTDGTNGQAITTNGTGQLAFTTISGGSSPVAFAVSLATNSANLGVPWIFPTVNEDTNSAYNSSTGQYTIPAGQGGLWMFGGSMYSLSVDFYFRINKNGTPFGQSLIGGGASTGQPATNSFGFVVAPGDVITMDAASPSTSYGPVPAYAGSGWVLDNFFGFKV